MKSKITPRDYQSKVHVATMEALWAKTTLRGLVLEPTGVGKSVQIAMTVDSVLEYAPEARIVMLTHSKELVEQNYEKLANMTAHDVGLWSAGLNKKDYHAPVVYAGIQTVARNPQMLGRRDIIIVDEAHRVSPDPNTDYQTVQRYLSGMNPHSSWVGYTATDYRLGQGLLTDTWYNRATAEHIESFWKEIVIDLTSTEEFNWFINNGYLKRLVPRPTQTEIEISGVRMRGGEYVASDVEKVTNTQEKIRQICDEICDMGFDRRSWMVFAAGNDNAELIASELTARGVPTVCVTDRTPTKEREKAIADYKAYRIRCLVNNNIFTTGFDHNGVDLIAVVRLTASTQLWVQMLGRGTRPVYASGFDLNFAEERLASIAASGVHNCLVLDFAGNSKRLGAINAPVKPKPKGAKSGGDMPTKVCGFCGVINPTMVKFCEYCTQPFPVRDPYDAVASSQELIKEVAHVPDKRTFRVSSIKFDKRVTHLGAGKGDVSRIVASYRCAKDGTYTEYLAFNGERSTKRIKAWWDAFGDGKGVPRSNDEFLATYSVRVKTPSVIEVYINPPRKTKPEITYYGFADTGAFEAQYYNDDDES